MWLIKRKHDGKKVHLIAKEYFIGRKACTIEITDDATVSRKHCKIFVEKQKDGNQSSLKVMDLNSTFGVYVSLPNSTSPVKLNPNEWMEVKCNSTIIFGTTNHWVLGWQDIPVLVSGNVNPDRKKRLQSLLEILGAKVCHEWNPSVMFLVMDKIAFTQKVLEVLLAAIPITTVEFFERWFQSLEENPESPSPSSSDYLPPLDTTLSSQFKDHDFLPNPYRRVLFAGKSFLFPLPGQLHSTSAMAVKKAGGRVVSEDHSSLNDDQLVVIDRDNHAEKSLPCSYVSQAKLVLAHGERLIPEREISLAILSSSCQRYCNPRYVSVSATRGQQNTARKTEREPEIVKNSIDIEEPPAKRQKLVTYEEPMEVTEPPSKRLKIATSSEATTSKKILKSTFHNTTYKASFKVHDTSRICETNCYSRISETLAVSPSTCQKSVNDTFSDRSSWLRVHKSLLEKSQVIRAHSFRSNPSAFNPKNIFKAAQRRVRVMKTVAFKDGKWT